MVESGASTLVIRDGKVYEFYLKETNLKPRYHRQHRVKKAKLNPHTFKYEDCKLCGTLMVNKICLNKECTNAALDAFD